MTTKQIVEKALEIINSKLEVRSITFSNRFSIEGGYESIDFLVHYTYNGISSNFTASIVSSIKNYSIESLFIELKNELNKLDKIESNTTIEY